MVEFHILYGTSDGMSIVTIMYTIYSGKAHTQAAVFLTLGGLSAIIVVVYFTREHKMWFFERLDTTMLVSVTNCVSHGGAFFFRKPREARPIDCSLLDLHELAEETGISVDEVICGLEDFGSADTLMGFGVPLAESVHVRDFLHIDADMTPRPRILRESLLEEEPVPAVSVEAIRIFPEEEKAVFREPESERLTAAEEIAAEPVVEPEPEQILPREAEVVLETAQEITEPLVEQEPEIAPTVDVEIVVEAEPVPEPVEEKSEEIKPIFEVAATREEKKAEAPKADLPAARPAPKKPLNIPHLDLEAIRRISTVRVEAAEPEDDGEDEPLIDLHVPDDYAVQTTTENIVWPWEIREDLTLKEALESLDDKLLTSLTEEVVSCTISGQMGEGGIKSLCETYNRAKEQIYSAIQQESRRRITRMNAKPRAASGTAGSDATLELAVRMAKQFLETEMAKEKATRFQSTIPNDDGNYYIFQKHRIEDEDSVEFPNERVYYRETGNGWAISVGY